MCLPQAVCQCLQSAVITLNLSSALFAQPFMECGGAVLERSYMLLMGDVTLAVCIGDLAYVYIILTQQEHLH